MLKEKIEIYIEELVAWLRPQPGALLGARVAALLLAVVFVVLAVRGENIGLWAWLEFSIGILLAVLIAVLGYWGMQWALWFFSRLPQKVVAAATVLALVFSIYLGFSTKLIWPLSIAILISVLIVGGVLGALILDKVDRWQRIWLYLLLALVVGGNAGFFYWVLHPREDPLAWVSLPDAAAGLDLENPAMPGDYPVLTLTYGSGTDRWRPEYGEAADILTESVNAGSYVYFEDWERKSREWYWGFDRDEFPLNGRVWYPDGEGRFPLVLIAHGNHAMTDFSDEGYAYLGELLASRGFIVVSVDQNYLNSYFTGRVSGENDARAWLLLQHLELWEDWQNDAASLFYRQVDMQNIALIGHSRGGEAVALAAAFNQLDRNPNNATIGWDFNFNIRGVIAIAPVDGQHKPGGQETPLKDVNYLVIQGAQDSDVSYFMGIRQFNRVSFSADSEAFKSALYIHRANHGQFNTTWGAYDRSLPQGWFLNTSTLLDAEDQREIAKVYISAFLETVLRDEIDYRPLFQNYQAGEEWLPEALVVNQYGDAGTLPLITFEEDIDVSTGTYPGVELKGFGLGHWREINLDLRKNKKQEDRAVSLRWNSKRDRFQITLPVGIVGDLKLTEEQVLVFDLGDGRKGEVDTLLDLHVCLETASLAQACVLLSDYAQVMPQFRAQFTTWPLWEESSFDKASEPILQSYRIPLEDFLRQNPDFPLEKLLRINFVFDVVDSGTVLLDDVGFAY